MAGEAAAIRAVRRPAAAYGLAAALGAVSGRPGGFRESGEVAAEARRLRAGARAHGRGAREGRACGARGCAAAAAVVMARAVGWRPAPWAIGCGERLVPETRRRASRRRQRPRFDPVSSSPAPFIVLCPWEEKHDVLERGRETGGLAAGSPLAAPVLPSRAEATGAPGPAVWFSLHIQPGAALRSEPVGRGRRPLRGAPACSGELF